MTSHRKIVIKNTALLYLLQGSALFFSFISLPYQARVVGPEYFGRLGFIAAVMIFVQLLLDFGMMLYATGKISENRENKSYVAKVMTAAVVIKLLLALISMAFLILASLTIAQVAESMELYIAYFIATLALSLAPDFVFRGLEDMKTITYRTVIVRAMFVVLLFIFLREREQYWVIPILLFVTNLLAAIIAYAQLKKVHSVGFVKVSSVYVKKTFVGSSQFFVSRIATAIYGALNTLVLGLFVPHAQLGSFVSADKLLGTARSATSPLADSLYPYMVKHRDFSGLKKLLIYSMPVVIAGSTIIFVFAEQICNVLFGPEFTDAPSVLRIFTPIIALTLPLYLLGFPTLSALGKVKHANYSIMVAASFHLVGLGALMLANAVSIMSVAALALITELVALIYRVIIIYKYRSLISVERK